MTDPNGPTDAPGSTPPEQNVPPVEPTVAPSQSPVPDQQTAPEQPTAPGQPQQYPSSQPQQPYPPQGQQPYPQQPYPGQAPQQPYPAQGQQPYPPQQGQPVPGAPYGAQPPAPPRKGLKPWAWWLIGGGAALIVLIVVAVVLVVVLAANGGAKPVAQQYLTSISKGDATGANKLARVDTHDDNNVFLTNAVLGKAEHISDPQVVKTTTSRSSDLTYASVTFKLDGKTYRGAIELDKDDKGWFVRQGLVYHLPYLSSAAASSDAGYTLDGGKAAVTSDDYDLVAYPGVYTVAAPSKFFTLSTSVKITVAPDAPTSLKNVTLKPSQKYIDAVQDQVNAHYDKCATLTDYYDIEDCGIDLGFPDNVEISGSKVALKVGDYPTVKVDDSDSYNQFKLDGGTFTATITGATYDGGQASETIDAAPGYTSAQIGIKDGKVTVDFD